MSWEELDVQMEEAKTQRQAEDAEAKEVMATDQHALELLRRAKDRALGVGPLKLGAQRLQSGSRWVAARCGALTRCSRARISLRHALRSLQKELESLVLRG